MAENTGIEWTDHTQNFWVGCTKVSPACDHCYAEAINLRFNKGDNWGPHAERRRSSPATFKAPFKWNREAEATGMRPRVFTLSMGDFWDNAAPEGARLDALRVIYQTPNLDWQILTKRPGNIPDALDAAMRAALAAGEANFFRWLWDWVHGKPPGNVWLGCTVVNQVEANRDIRKLLAAPARIRFLSIEPMLGPIDLHYPKDVFPDGPTMCCSGYDCGCRGQPIDPPLVWGINWVICGGESGPGFRPIDLAWARSLRDQCREAGVKFFMKQTSGVIKASMPPIPDDLMIREFPQ